MKTEIELENWPRREHFEFFRSFDDPFFGVTVKLDCTLLYEHARKSDKSFFLCYLHKTLAAVNQTDAFKLRIKGDKVFYYDTIHASPTLNRPNGTFAFGQIDFHKGFDVFADKARNEIKRVENTNGLFTREFSDDIIHFSAIPWIDFTALSHARKFHIGDSCPKISFGKMTADGDRKNIAMSVHVHHGLADAIHVSAFIDVLQSLFPDPGNS